MSADLLSRQELIARLHAAVRALPSVHAAWLEGADANGRADAGSDIDLWLDVDAGQERVAFAAVRGALSLYGPLDVEDRRRHADPLIHQCYYRSVGLSPFWVVDVCVQTHGRDVAFGPHDPFRVLFDHSEVIKTRVEGWTAGDVRKAAEALAQRRWRSVLVEKELWRGHLLEALAYYHSEVLGPLLELLRLRYLPGKRGYGLKHIHADLPRDAVDQLEELYGYTRPEELSTGVGRAERWFDQLLLELQP